mgnify:CR=1 FL=1
MLLSSTCVACQTPGPSLCRRCRFALAALPPVPAHHGPDGAVIRGALPFDGIGRQLVVGLKYRTRRAAAAVLAGAHIVRVHAVAEMVQVVRVAEDTRRHGRIAESGLSPS